MNNNRHRGRGQHVKNFCHKSQAMQSSLLSERCVVLDIDREIQSPLKMGGKKVLVVVVVVAVYKVLKEKPPSIPKKVVNLQR